MSAPILSAPCPTSQCTSWVGIWHVSVFDRYFCYQFGVWTARSESLLRREAAREEPFRDGSTGSKSQELFQIV